MCDVVAVPFAALEDSQWLSSGGSVSLASSFWSDLKVILSNCIAAVCSCNPESAMYFFIAAFSLLPQVVPDCFENVFEVLYWCGGKERGKDHLAFLRR